MDKKSKSKMKHPVLFALSVILMLAFLAVTALGGRISMSLTAEPYNFNELTPEISYHGQIVSGQVFASLGTFGQQYKLDDKGNIISADDLDYYFLVPANDNYSITIVTDDKNIISDLTALTAATDNYRNGLTDSIEFGALEYGGMLIEMNEDELSHLYTWALQNGLFGAETAEEVAENLIPYKICAFNRGGGLPMLLIGCAGFMGFGIAMIVFMKQRADGEEDTENNYESDHADGE